MRAPAPWTIEEDELPYILDANNEPVAIVVSGEDNEHLLRTAPELLAALEELLVGVGSSPAANRKYAKARAAIAKARGES
jgi:GTP cyclohydrolase III